MIKLTMNEYLMTSSIEDFNRRHKTNYRTWTEYFSVVGHDWEKDAGITHEEDYKLYLLWFEIVNTPLVKALEEIA